MSYRIAGLDPQSFAPLFALDDAALAALGARRVTADADVGFPCRVSLEDARSGEALILVHYEHQPAATPFRASHAIYVRRVASQAWAGIGTLPPTFGSRTLSLRAFDAEGMMIDADLVDGAAAGPLIERMFTDKRAAYIHAHYAKPGCFAARIDRA